MRLRLDQFLSRRLELFGRHWRDDRRLIIDPHNRGVRCHFRPVAEAREGLVRYIDERRERDRRALFGENFVDQLESLNGDARKACIDRPREGGGLRPAALFVSRAEQVRVHNRTNGGGVAFETNGDVVFCQRGVDEQKVDDRVSDGEIGVHDEAMIQGQSGVGDEFCKGALCGEARKGPFIANCSAPREWVCDGGSRPSPMGGRASGIRHLAVSFSFGNRSRFPF